jgi:hypothetical protein
MHQKRVVPDEYGSIHLCSLMTLPAVAPTPTPSARRAGI